MLAHTLSVHDLFRITCEDDSTILRVHIELFCGTEVFSPGLEETAAYTPRIVRRIFVKHSMHDLNRLVCKFINLRNPFTS